MKRASSKQRFKDRVLAWAERLEVDVNGLAVRPMRAKWASCSTSGHLNFNTELLGLDANLQEYVIVHELLHLRTPNHGKLWKSLMRAHLGEFEASEAKLMNLAQKGAPSVGCEPE